MKVESWQKIEQESSKYNVLKVQGGYRNPAGFADQMAAS